MAALAAIPSAPHHLPPLAKTASLHTNTLPLLPVTHSSRIIQAPNLHLPNLHAHLTKRGLLPHLYTHNTLIDRYFKDGDILSAHNLFDEMSERNLVSWTSLISGYSRMGLYNESFGIFLQMMDSGYVPNEFAFGSLLRSCGESGDICLGAQLHGLTLKTGLLQNVFVGSCLIIMYAKTGRLDLSESVLRRMQKSDAFCWTSMVISYSNGGCSSEALALFANMLQEDVRPNEYTLTGVLKACAALDAEEEGAQIHAYAIKTGLGENISVQISLVDFYGKIGDLCSARTIYERAVVHEVVLCTAMIGAYACCGESEFAIKIFLQMREVFELCPNEFTYANTISACADIGSHALGACFHALAVKTGHAGITHVEGALIDMYTKSGDMKGALKAFEMMDEKDKISCSSILAGFSYNQLDEEALDFYSTLHALSIRPESFAVASATTSCAKLADQLRGRQIHAQVIKHGHESDICVASALIDMYSKSGSVNDAEKVFCDLPKRDRIAWTAIIDGYAQHGEGRMALKTFERMVEEEVIPNGITFVGVLSACSHSGLVDEGLKYFHLMHSKYDIKPALHHYACVVDLLGRSGRLEEALLFINQMPLDTNPPIWRSFLGACRIHKNLELGTYAANCLLGIAPQDDSTFVLLANMFASAGMWEDAARVRIKMKEQGVRKLPGCSWIEAGKRFHVFTARDSTHPQKDLIYKKLDDLNCKLKASGYVPDTECSLHDGEEDEKERLLSFHSERLAVAFGLIATPEGSCLRIFKNLRVCGDCHNAMKIISLVYKRKIILRDATRFHHFSEGSCSCRDYW